jgi:hypothetical protein
LGKDFYNNPTIGASKSGKSKVESAVGTRELQGPTLKVNNSDDISLGVAGEAAVILGVKVNVEFGFRTINK